MALKEGSSTVAMIFKKKKPDDSETPYLLVDEAPFEFVRGKNGIISLVSPGKAQAIKSKQRRYKLPKEPLIKAQIKQGLSLREELSGDPKLTRATLARRHGIEASMLSRLIHLANMAPEIQEHIRNIRPSTRRGSISMCRLLPIIRNQNHERQRQEFQKLL